MDEDLQTMSNQELQLEVIKLRNAIRQHRDAQGHNLCWFVPELWNLLPDHKEVSPNPPPLDEFLQCCKSYRQSLEDK